MARKFEFDDWFLVVTLVLGRIHWEMVFRGEWGLAAFTFFLWGMFMLLEFKLQEFEEEAWKRKVYD